MIEKCHYDDGIDESCLQIDHDNKNTEESMKKLSINESNEKTCPVAVKVN